MSNTPACRSNNVFTLFGLKAKFQYSPHVLCKDKNFVVAGCGVVHVLKLLDSEIEIVLNHQIGKCLQLKHVIDQFENTVESRYLELG